MSATDRNKTSSRKEPVRLPARRRTPLTEFTIPALALIAGVMLFLAVPNIITGTDTLSYAKALFLAASATVVAYGVNRLAIERGAPLATIGFPGAAVISVLAILAVGAGLYGATYSGLTIGDVAQLRAQEHGVALSEFAGKRATVAAEAVRARPAMRVIADDLEAKARCEVATSCVSGRAGGGRGPVARALEEESARAAAIASELDAGDTARIQAVAELNRLLEEYQRILSETGRAVWERRSELQIIDSGIRQAAATLDEAIPLPLLSAYAAELQGGGRISDDPEATRRLNAILMTHGQSLASVLASIDQGDALQPTFPPRTGVSDTFAYIGHFLPVAAIVAVVELIFPLLLWTYTYWAISWEKFKADPPAREMADTRHSALESVSARSSAHHPEPAKQSDATRGTRHRSRSRGNNRHRNPEKLNGAGDHDGAFDNGRTVDETPERDDVR